MRKKVFFTMIFVLALTGCSFNYLTLGEFRLANRGIWEDTIEDFQAFYGYVILTWATLGWYVVSGLIVWVVIRRLRQLKGGWRKWVITTGLIALFIAPGVFVDPERAPNVMTLVSAAEFDIPSLVLPAWVSILGYWLLAPYRLLHLIYRVIASWITFWTIGLTWFVLLGLSLCTKATRDFLWR